MPFRKGPAGRAWAEMRAEMRAVKHTKKRDIQPVSDFLVISGTSLCGKLTIYCQGLALLVFLFLQFLLDQKWIINEFSRICGFWNNHSTDGHVGS